MSTVYEQLIAVAIGESDPATLAVVEDIMRDGQALDGLTRAQFVARARQAHEDMQILAATGQLVGYCAAVGLPTPGRYLN